MNEEVMYLLRPLSFTVVRIACENALESLHSHRERKGIINVIPKVMLKIVHPVLKYLA